MAHIKKMVVQGFKSFAKRTEIIFDNSINTIVGPNGSGKSNITDALCFVLGRLSIKSMRAAKAKNLIFMGSKYMKPSKEASVELIFDNSDRKFSMDADEIIIRRAVKINGQSSYKLNGENKTRAEIIETLAQVGIDPYGFNLVLQGEIQAVVKMHGEERRKIIEEVAGISVYESRKEKSLKELEKTDERLKEIGTILRERTTYLNTLEKEKSQAERFNELKETVRKLKASILKKKFEEKSKEIESIKNSIEEKSVQKSKRSEKIEKAQSEVDNLSEKIFNINKYIQKASGLEQSRLREEITTLKADLEGLKVRSESYENRKRETEKRIEELQKAIPEIEFEIKDLRQKQPGMAKKASELRKKKEELAEIEKQRKRILTLKTELSSLRDRIEDKQKQLARTAAESESIVRQMEELSENFEFSTKEECQKELSKIKELSKQKREKISELSRMEIENERAISVAESEIARNSEIKNKVEKIDTCPLCQSKMTESHISHVFKECDEKISSAKNTLSNSQNTLKNLAEQRKILNAEIESLEKKSQQYEKEISYQKSVEEKNKILKNSVDYESILKKEIKELSERRASLESASTDGSQVEQKYQEKIMEIEEISSRTEVDLGTTLLYKERDLEKSKNIIFHSREDLQEISNQISSIKSNIKQKEDLLEEKLSKEEELNKKFNKMFKERDEMQKKIQEENLKLNEMQSEVRQIEEQVNYLRIGKAKLDSEKETVEIDLAEYRGVELIQGSSNYLEDRLVKTKDALDSIGSINMRALEVYDQIKKEYDSVKEKVDILTKEREEVLKIIEEIDKKKYKTFMRTFKALNELFSRNFSKLSVKGASAYLEIENQEDIFAGGINIVVKMGKGKYFDVTSLSGGEKTLVALSLLFAIQEYRPYQFYVLDEIDAALDKRNSERLAALLNQYMQSGQYIIITHNDAIILNSQILYGVSMHDGVSKILSLHIGDEENQKETTQQN